MCGSRTVTLTVGFKPEEGHSLRRTPRSKLKPKIQGDCSAWTAGSDCNLLLAGVQTVRREANWAQLLAQVELVDQLFVPVGLRFA